MSEPTQSGSLNREHSNQYEIIATIEVIDGQVQVHGEISPPLQMSNFLVENLNSYALDLADKFDELGALAKGFSAGIYPLSMPDLTTSILETANSLVAGVDSVTAMLGLDSAVSLPATDANLNVDLLQTELETKAQQIGPYFVEVGLWLSPSMPMSLWGQICRSFSTDDLTATVLEDMILQEFRADNYESLRFMIDGWWNRTEFQVWRRHIEDASEAHTMGKYTLTVPALLVVFEGLMRSLFGGQKLRYIPDSIEASLSGDLFLEPVYSGAFVAAICRLVSTVGENTVLTEQYCDQLYRHLILHGRNPDYDSELNSLRGFLLLDWLSHLATKHN